MDTKMGYIFYIMGKSSSGKDSIYKKLIEEKRFPLKTVVGYTTRPIRSGETSGIEYHFVDNSTLNNMKEDKIVIECRNYNTIHGVWSYFTADDGQVDLNKNSYLLIGTLESYEKIRNYYGEDKLIPLYIEVDDGERLTRALNREKDQVEPKYAEMCRRFLADEEDFKEENLRRCGIVTRYKNVDLDSCILEIGKHISEQLGLQ